MLAVLRPASAQTPQRVVPIAPDLADSLTRGILRVMNATPITLERLRLAAGRVRGPYSSRAIAPLDPARAVRLRRAVALREQGRRELARDSLRVLNAELPHHAQVVTELGRTLQSLDAHGELARFARAERLAKADSLLLGRELVAAEERLGHPTEAALVAIEMWASSPLESQWASAELQRLPPANAGRVREALSRATLRDPQREDLALGLARLDWRAGDEVAMLRTLAAVDRPAGGGAVRRSFAEELVQSGVPRDSSAALDVLIALCGDRGLRVDLRQAAAQRAWEVALARVASGESAARIAHALVDVPHALWDGAFALELARSLRESGHTSEARLLLAAEKGAAVTVALALERALADLRDGPPSRALPALRELAASSSEAAFDYAEALFFSAECDSALAWYLRAAGDPAGSRTGAALERAYLLEDARPRTALPALAGAFYAAWRGDARGSRAQAPPSCRQRVPIGDR